jgi:transcriptional regulator with XRE-family HTH domain
MRTFGQAIAQARRAAGYTQRELAAAIAREGGASGISPAYLNDIEHDRRIPSSDHIILGFAKSLNVNSDYLLLLASRQLPEEIAAKARSVDQETYRNALEVFDHVLSQKAQVATDNTIENNNDPAKSDSKQKKGGMQPFAGEANRET